MMCSIVVAALVLSLFFVVGLADDQVEVFDPKIHLRRSLRGASSEYSGTQNTVEYTFTAFKKNYRLILNRQPGLQDVEHFKQRQDGGFDRESVSADCFFSGKEASDHKSKVFLSFCNDELHAHIKMQDSQFSIKPVQSRRNLAEIRKHNMRGELKTCAVKDRAERTLIQDDVAEFHDQVKKIERNTLPRKGKRSLASERVVEVLVVNDKERFDDYGNAVAIHTVIIHNMMNDLYSSFPGDDAISFNLVGIITYSVQDPWVATTGCTILQNIGCNFVLGGINQCCVKRDTRDSYQVDLGNGLLTIFDKWQETEQTDIVGTDGSNLQYDLAHLLSGHDFFASDLSDGVVGLATVGILCQTSFSQRTGITQATSTNELVIASVYAHELGHNLGFEHTNIATIPGGNTCDGTSADFIMDASGNQNTEWSLCTEEWWEKHIQDHLSGSNGGFDPTCADAEEEPEVPGNGSYCGNGIVEGDEECDCGLSDCSAVDTCCDGATCTLASGQCAANDPCCKSDCSFADAGTVCRSQKDSECDTQEVCSGTSKECPEDNFAETGTACDSGQGNCFKGECINPTQQCVDSTLGSVVCSQSICSQLRCSNTLPCTSFTFFDGLGMADGSECGDGKGCYDGDCVDFSSIPTEPHCTSFVRDEDETDVDCGGADCLGCLVGQKCKVSSDCRDTFVCNNSTGLCEESDDILNAFLRFFEDLLAWMSENPLYASLIGIGIVALLSLLCFFCGCCGRRSSSSKDVIPRAREFK